MQVMVQRLFGAILVFTADEFYLVGDFKQPAALAEFGLHLKGTYEASRDGFVRLVSTPIDASRWRAALVVEGEPQAVASMLARRLLIRRNGSVSERLWRLIEEDSPRLAINEGSVVDARWLLGVPEAVWDAVRDSVLRC